MPTEEVTSNALATYLRNGDWQVSDYEGLVTVWKPPASWESRIQAILPEVGVEHSPTMIQAAIQAVASAEHRRVQEVVDDVLLGGSDNVSIRFQPKSPQGQAPLTLAAQATVALRDYVIGSAAALTFTEGILPPRRPRAESYSGTVRFSTEPGSFVIHLALPLYEPDTTEATNASDLLVESLTPAIPYGRQVSRRMESAAAHAIELADRVSRNEAPISAFVQGDLQAPINATELDGLAALGGSIHLKYQVSYRDTPLIDHRPPKSRILQVSQSHQEVFRKAAEVMRHQNHEGVTVTGVIQDLKRKTNLGYGDIGVVGTYDGDPEPHTYWVNLSETDYLNAIQAHRDKRTVVVQGDLDYSSDRRRLNVVTRFEILSAN